MKLISYTLLGFSSLWPAARADGTATKNFADCVLD